MNRLAVARVRCTAALVAATISLASFSIHPPRAAAGPAPAAVESRADIVAARGARFIAAVNDSSIAARRAALPEIYSAATIRETSEKRLLDHLARLHADFAPLQFHHAEVLGRALHVFAKRPDRNVWHDFQFFYDSAPPHGLLGLQFIAETTEPVLLPNGAVDSPETLAWLDGYVDRLRQEYDLSGSFLIARGDRVLWRRSIGYADSARAYPVTDTTRFNLGSGNKMFTALAIMRLVDEGRVRLEQTLAEFVPDFPDPALAKRITVAQLLAHSSGLGDYLTDDFRRDGARVRSIQEILPFAYAEFGERGPYFPPGTEHRYSNTGYLLLGRILEVVTGEDYFDVIRARVYRPAGLKRTDHVLWDGPASGLAEPLARAPEASRGTTAAAPWTVARHGRMGSSAGGGFSTCDDILSFGRALARGSIVPLPLLERMTSPQPPLAGDDVERYGLGFLLQSTRGGVNSYGHGGIAPGVNFEFRYFPGEDVTLVLFGNQDNGAYDDLRKNMTRLVTGER